MKLVLFRLILDAFKNSYPTEAGTEDIAVAMSSVLASVPVVPASFTATSGGFNSGEFLFSSVSSYR